jgi:hypothetical protein
MTTDEKLELIEVYRRITALENRVFKWKRRFLWIACNAETWGPIVVVAMIFGYLGFFIGYLCYSKPY